MKLYLECSLAIGLLLGVLPLVAQTREQKRPRIEWDRTTLSLIQTNGRYARVIRLDDGERLCGFDFRGKIWVRHSRDESSENHFSQKQVLRSPKASSLERSVPRAKQLCNVRVERKWGELIEVAESPLARLTNTELLQLRNGVLLCFYNERPYARSASASASQTQRPFAIHMARSEDCGRTWQTPVTLYSAGVEFGNGCWEPAAIQLPSDEVQVVFANEGPYRNSDEQEITMLRSSDNARTWSSPEKISFRPGHRDGMPVPLVLNHGRGIAVAVEDNGLSGNFKPTIVFTSLKDNWRIGPREPGSTNRWSALRDLPEPSVVASAPYLRQMPSGETLLSFQRSDTGEIHDAYMVVCIGDAHARDFASASRPFASTDAAWQLWNSLFIKDRNTIVAVSEAFINEVHGIWMIEGRFVR